MNSYRLEEFTGGWFVGNFLPTVVKTSDFEVGFKRYSKGATEAAHYQLTAWEITLVVEGDIELGGQRFGPGDLVIIQPGEVAGFKALVDCALVCVKSPSIPADKVVC